MNRQEELLTGGGEAVGDDRAEGLLATWDGAHRHSHLTLMARVSDSCWIQFHLPSWKKQSSDVWGVALFFFCITDDMAALDCFLNGCCNLRVPFYIQVLWLKNEQCSSNKENVLAIACIMNLLGSSVTSSSSCLPSSFRYRLARLSSTSYITAAFMLVSGHPGLEIKIYTTLYTTVVVVQPPSHTQLFATPWTAAHQASLSITNS